MLDLTGVDPRLLPASATIGLGDRSPLDFPLWPWVYHLGISYNRWVKLFELIENSHQARGAYVTQPIVGTSCLRWVDD